MPLLQRCNQGSSGDSGPAPATASYGALPGHAPFLNVQSSQCKIQSACLPCLLCSLEHGMMQYVCKRIFWLKAVFKRVLVILADLLRFAFPHEIATSTVSNH